MKTALQFCIIVAIIFCLLLGGGAVWMIWKGADVVGAGADVVQKEGLKGLGVRLWCGERGCK